jgi:hypothetical protein
MTPIKAKPLELGGRTTEADGLAYAVELWTEDSVAPEQTLARALNAALARAVFIAAKEEHPDRHIVLRHGDRVVDET